MIVAMVHHFVKSVHLSAGFVDHPILFHCTAAIIISPNERVSPTMAGTKASHINSLRLKLSSHPMRLDPATNRNVKSGENIAYIHSFTALTISIAVRASVNSPNTANIIVLTIDVCTICSAADAISGHLSSCIF